MALQDLFGPIATRTNVIGDLDTFILSNVPYGIVHPGNIQWGAIEFDGPRAPGIDGAKPLMQWHFGGVPYPITKALRIYYTYLRTWDGSNATVTDSILLGSQEKLDDYGHVEPVPWVQNALSQPGARVLTSNIAILASVAGVIVRGAPRSQAPSGVPSLHGIVQSELAQTGPDCLSFRGNPVAVDFDGPAQDSDSHNVFTYTVETLFNEPGKYAQLLFWYFAGRPHRVTKALRIPLGVPDQDGYGLFIGYTGGTPGGG
jgi:hypothetical protein